MLDDKTLEDPTSRKAKFSATSLQFQKPVHRGEMGRSFVTTGRMVMATLHEVGLVTYYSTLRAHGQ